MEPTTRGDAARVRNELRRKVEAETLALERMKRLLGVEGDTGDLHDAVVRLVAERDELLRRLAELGHDDP